MILVDICHNFVAAVYANLVFALATELNTCNNSLNRHLQMFRIQTATTRAGGQ
jgi:hypothetical protein